jgi:MIF4G like
VRRKVVVEGAINWANEDAVRGDLGGARGVLAAVFRALLTAGSKSFTHMITAIERYEALLRLLLQETGPEVGLAMVFFCLGGGI